MQRTHESVVAATAGVASCGDDRLVFWVLQVSTVAYSFSWETHLRATEHPFSAILDHTVLPTTRHR